MCAQRFALPVAHLGGDMGRNGAVSYEAFNEGIKAAGCDIVVEVHQAGQKLRVRRVSSRRGIHVRQRRGDAGLGMVGWALITPNGWSGTTVEVASVGVFVGQQANWGAWAQRLSALDRCGGYPKWVTEGKLSAIGCRGGT